jgi:hypothetical protein
MAALDLIIMLYPAISTVRRWISATARESGATVDGSATLALLSIEDILTVLGNASVTAVLQNGNGASREGSVAATDERRAQQLVSARERVLGGRG